jgi:RNA polymerase sigma factor (sigma-70 family)
MAQEQLSLVLQEIRRLAGAGQGGCGSDAELLDRFLALHDEGAFEVLLRRHGPIVWAVCRRILDRDHDAEDVFQATFFVLAQKASSIRKPDSLASWLYGVACRLARKYQAEQAQQRAHEKNVSPPTSTDPVRDLEIRESAQIVVEEVERLPDHYRAPVVLCHLAGQTHEVAAAELGCPVGTLKARLSRALKLLAKRLARRGLALPAGLTAAVLGKSEAAALVPAGLLVATAAGAVSFASGSAGTSSSAAAVRLARAAMVPLLVRFRAMVLLAAGVLLAGGGILAQQQWNAPPSEPESAEVPLAEPPQPPPPAVPIPQPLAEPALAGLPRDAVARLGSSAFLHGNNPGMLRFSTDGRLLLTADGTGSVHLWRADTGQELRHFPWPGGIGRKDFASLVLSPDGQWVAARNNRDPQVHVWEVAKGKEVAAYAPNLGTSPIGYLPGGELLARSSGQPGLAGGNAYCLWDAAGKQLRHILPSAQEPFVLSGNGKILATLEAPSRPPPLVSFRYPSDLDLTPRSWSRKPTTIHLWDIAQGRRLASLVYPEGIREERFALSPRGTAVLTCDDQNRVHIREFCRGEERLRFAISGWPCTCSSDDRMLAVVDGSHHARVVVWDLAGRKILCQLESAGRAGPAFSPDDKTLATGGKDRRVHLWDTSSWTERFPQAEHDDVRSLAFAPDGAHLLSVGLDHSGETMNLVTWNVARREVVSRSAVDWQQYLGMTADAELLVRDGAWGTMGRHDPFGRRPTRLLADSAGAKTSRLYNQGRTLIRWEGDDLFLGDPDTGQWRGPLALRLRRGREHDGDFIVSAVAAPGNTVDVIVWRKGQGFRHLLFQAATRELLVERAATGEPLGSRAVQAVFSADARIWAPGERFFAPGVWETCTGTCVLSVEREESEVPRLWFSPNSRLVFIGGGRGRPFLRICDLVQGKEVQRFECQDGAVASVAFSPDGRKLATGFANGAILVRDLSALGVHLKGSPLTVSTDQLEQWWAALAETNTAGYRASWLLVDAAEQVLPLLEKRLHPVAAADPAQVRELLARLQSGTAAERELAWANLQRLGAEAEPELRRALATELSPDLRNRLETFLKALPGLVHFPPPGERLRRVRAVAVLERIGTPTAQQVLENLARGLPGAEQTVHAQAALSRLQTGSTGSRSARR